MFDRSTKPCKHRFKPRYDESRITPDWLRTAVADAARLNIGGPAPHDWRKTYVCDVCTRCGELVTRQKEVTS